MELVRIDPKTLLAPEHYKNIKIHLNKRINERLNVDVTRSDLKYFESILRQSDGRTVFYGSRPKDLIMKYIPSNDEYKERNAKLNRSTFILNFHKRLICLYFENFILKTIMRAGNRHIRFWNARSTRAKFPLLPVKKMSKADRIQKLINDSDDKLIRREHWLKYYA